MKVHFIAIGGSAMHNLALALRQKDYTVTGSDDEIFEPSRSRLHAAGLLPERMGWFPEENIHPDLDFVVLGMHARPDNPELKRARELGLRVVSYPEFLYQQSQDKTRIVIAGSHGKTTIAAMILHVLHYHQRPCDFMIGAQLEGFDTMVQLSESNEFILLEGDEYLSSPLDPEPKFVHYRPNICLLSGIAWDHVNVFPTYEEYRAQFKKLLDVIEPGGALIYNTTDAEVKNLVENSEYHIKRFGYAYPDYERIQGQTWLHTPEGPVALEIFGRHNMNNLEGARWICNQMGVTDEEFHEAIASFKGASRRLESIHRSENLRVIRDFAHAPSKVKASVQAVRESFPEHRILACLELHTFSSLQAGFMEEYSGSMAAADQAVVYYNPKVVAHKKLPPLSREDVRERFNEPTLQVIDDNQNLISYIKGEVKDDKTLLLLMSSGSFDGIDWLRELDL